MSRTDELIALVDRYGAHNYHPLPVVIERAERIWMWDVEGKKYLDFLASYSAVNQGHCHPKIVKAMADQANRVTLTSRAFHNEELGPFFKELCELTQYEKALPMNSGAEAVETAIKMVRKWGYQEKKIPDGKAEIIVCAGNFHGRTTTIISFSDEPQYRDGFGPFAPGFKTIPYGDVAALKAAITPNTTAFMVEPIQGEAGVVVPPHGYLAEVKKVCKTANVLFVADEIQTGFGRTGKLFCHLYEDAKPDAMILGKALGGGLFPVSAVVSSDEIMGVFRPGDHGSTFGGNPLACAIGRAALRVLVDERLTENAATLGSYFLERLRAIKSPHVKEIRGKGLLIGVELKKAAGGARRFCEALMQEGLLCKETHEDVIRFAPALVIAKDEIDWALARIEKVLKN